MCTVFVLSANIRVYFGDLNWYTWLIVHIGTFMVHWFHERRELMNCSNSTIHLLGHFTRHLKIIQVLAQYLIFKRPLWTSHTTTILTYLFPNMHYRIQPLKREIPQMHCRGGHIWFHFRQQWANRNICKQRIAGSDSSPGYHVTVLRPLWLAG